MKTTQTELKKQMKQIFRETKIQLRLLEHLHELSLLKKDIDIEKVIDREFKDSEAAYIRYCLRRESKQPLQSKAS